jgi:hypothetical protein
LSRMWTLLFLFGMRFGYGRKSYFNPLTPTLSRRERG